jgi:hypothetical protein
LAGTLRASPFSRNHPAVPVFDLAGLDRAIVEFIGTQTMP